MRHRGFPAHGIATETFEYRQGQPLKIEIGCGNGAALVAAALRDPDSLHLGIEAVPAYVAEGRQQIDRAHIRNARVLQGDGRVLLARLPPRSIEKISVLFPDPWPKRRHRKRRIVNRSFLDLAATRLKQSGVFVLKTDQAPYFEHAVMLLDGDIRFQRALVSGKKRHLSQIAPTTTFERKYQRQGCRIQGAVYMLVSRPGGCPR